MGSQRKCGESARIHDVGEAEVKPAAVCGHYRSAATRKWLKRNVRINGGVLTGGVGCHGVGG